LRAIGWAKTSANPSWAMPLSKVKAKGPIINNLRIFLEIKHTLSSKNIVFNRIQSMKIDQVIF